MCCSRIGLAVPAFPSSFSVLAQPFLPMTPSFLVTGSDLSLCGFLGRDGDSDLALTFANECVARD